MTASFVHNCTENDIRLEGGTSSLEGRVEVCVNGDWGTVTYYSWDYRDASVTCRQLGFSPLGIFLCFMTIDLWPNYYPGAVELRATAILFGISTGAIVLRNVRCMINETILASCSSNTPSTETHSSDAGVRCYQG